MEKVLMRISTKGQLALPIHGDFLLVIKLKEIFSDVGR